jgi:hypothetical protein
LINQLRAVLLERGIVVAKGRRQLETFLVTMLADGAEPPTTLSSRTCLLIEDMCLEWGELDRRIAALTAEFVARAREDQAARRLATIPGFGALNATALVAAIGTGESFLPARDLAAWLGLVPSGDDWRQASASRDHQARQDLPAHAPDPWRPSGLAVALGEPNPNRRVAARPRRTHKNTVVVALASKLARIASRLQTGQAIRHARAVLGRVARPRAGIIFCGTAVRAPRAPESSTSPPPGGGDRRR